MSGTAVVIEPPQKVLQSPINVHSDAPIRVDAPYRTWQSACSACFGNPTPTFVIDGQRQAGSKQGQWLFRMPTTGEIDVPDGRAGQAAGGLQELTHFGGEKSLPPGADVAQRFRLDARQRDHVL